MNASESIRVVLRYAKISNNEFINVNATVRQILACTKAKTVNGYKDRESMH